MLKINFTSKVKGKAQDKNNSYCSKITLLLSPTKVSRSSAFCFLFRTIVYGKSKIF